MPAGRFLSSSDGLPETAAALAGFDLSAVSPSTLAFAAASAFAVAGVFSGGVGFGWRGLRPRRIRRRNADGRRIAHLLGALARAFLAGASGVMSVVGPPSGAEKMRSICGTGW